MNLKNKILLKLSKKVLNKNQKYKKTHAGESCYIFGNGVSIKYFDLTKFNDKPSIGCGLLFLHNDFSSLNLSHYFMSHSFFFYKYWKNPYTRKYEKNPLGPIYRKNVELYSDINFFTSISNYFALQGSNVNYVHHFDQISNDLLETELDNVFSPMSGALDGMLGLAAYLGFNDVTLVGCDYTSKPSLSRHFYESGQIINKPKDGNFSEALLADAMTKFNIKTVTINDSYEGESIPSITYENLTNDKPRFKENNTIVLNSDLVELNQSKMRYKIDL